MVSILVELFTGTALASTTAEKNAHAADIIIVVARRTQHLSNAAHTIYVLDTEELSRDLPRTLPESLSAIPGVLVQKTASGHGSPYIRGFTGNRTLAVIDGIRYNNATYRDGANEYFAQIDSFTLDQIEILSGPASTLYGSEAVGGTISLRTKSSSFLDTDADKFFLSGKQIVRLSSGDNSVISRTMLDIGRGARWGLRIGGSIKNFGDVRAAKLGRLPETGYSEQAYDARLDIAIDPVWTATLAHQSLYQDDVPRAHSTLYSVPFNGTSIGSDLRRTKDQRRSLTYIKLEGAPKSMFIDSADITLSYQPRTEREHRIRQSGVDIRQSFSTDLWALNTVATSSFTNVNLTYGIDLSHEAIVSQRSDFDPLTQTTRERIQGPVGDDATYQQGGLFANAAWAATSNLTVELGGRASHIRADVGRFADPQSGDAISFKDNWSDLSGSLRIKYTSGPATLWGALSQSFRAPNIADISRFGRSRSNEFEVASFGLEPERFNTAEIGFRLAGDNRNFSATYYYTDLIDYIDTVPTGRMVDGLFEVSKQNSASGRIHGAEITGGYTLTPGLSLTGHLTWLDGELTRPIRGGGFLTEPISRIQPLTGYLALTWETNAFWAKAEYSGVARADKLSAGDLGDTQRIPPGGTPGHHLVNIRAGWMLNDDIELTVGAMNLLGEAYRSHGSGGNEPGRHVRSSLSVRF